MAVRRPKVKLRRILWPICFTTTFPCRSRLPKCPTEGCITFRGKRTQEVHSMAEVLSQTYGRPGKPGIVEVAYLSGLRLGHTIEVEVGYPGKGGAGGPAIESPVQGCPQFVDRGGAGGGRENVPILDALTAYAQNCTGTETEPLCFLEPGKHEVEWPYDTSTATLILILPGGGGGGGAGDTLPGEDGEDGLPGAAFIIPTYLPVQRPRE